MRTVLDMDKCDCKSVFSIAGVKFLFFFLIIENENEKCVQNIFFYHCSDHLFIKILL